MPDEEKEESPNPTEQSAGDPPETENDGGEGESTETPAQSSRAEQNDRAYEERLKRLEERNRQLEETNRLHERFYQQQPSTARQPADDLPEDLRTLDQTLAPILERRTGDIKKEFSKLAAQQQDALDETRFDSFVAKNYPEIDRDQDARVQLDQEVYTIRKRAAEVYGQWLSRQDAFFYVEGIKRSREREGKRTKANGDETARRQSVDATRSIPQKPALTKPSGNADIARIRGKMQRGELLTSDERAKFQDHMGDKSF